MKRLFEKTKEGCSFLENLGVMFTPEGLPVFPDQPRPFTAQDLAVLSKRLAYDISEAERPLGEIAGPIGALVCITGATTPVGGEPARRRRIWETEKFPSVVSQLTAVLGPDLYWFRGEGFGKLVRVFASYTPNERSFGVPTKPAEAVRPMAGLRTLFVVDSDVEVERVARLVKSCLSRAVHGEALKLTADELSEIKDLSSQEREEAENEMMDRKRSLLTAGVVFLATTKSTEEIEKALADPLGFTPRVWSICDCHRPPPKQAA